MEIISVKPKTLLSDPISENTVLSKKPRWTVKMESVPDPNRNRLSMFIFGRKVNFVPFPLVLFLTLFV